MPYTKKQNRLFRAVAHGWKPPRYSEIDLTKAKAAELAAEGVKKTKKKGK